MKSVSITKAKASPEQIRYANLLFWGAWSSILLMIVTYVIYLAGILDPYVPMDKVQTYWQLPVHEYVERANIPLGWGWVKFLNRGDFLNFLGLTLLGGMTIICFATLIPAYLKKKDWPFLIISICEVLILALAASGILAVGH
ncbi:MAG TPA: DUF1634 domain-containing protein [Deltaproteobacteria bacterium]|nr:DUF1634 domain-containing protein [Deltaproteobacteria bacterium]